MDNLLRRAALLATPLLLLGVMGCSDCIGSGGTPVTTTTSTATLTTTTRSDSTSSSTSSVEAAPRFPTPDEAAKAGLADLIALADDETYAELGFTTKDEVAAATLGKPFERRFVGLADLRKFKAGEDLDKLAPLATHMVYPVMVGEALRSSVIVARARDDTWAATELGRAKTAARLDQTRRGFAKRAAFPVDDIYFVWIPGMRLDMMAHGRGPNAKAGLPKGSVYDKWEGAPTPVTDVLAKLAEAAQNLPDDGPR